MSIFDFEILFNPLSIVEIFLKIKWIFLENSLIYYFKQLRIIHYQDQNKIEQSQAAKVNFTILRRQIAKITQLTQIYS